MMERHLPQPECKRIYGEALEVKLPDKDKEHCSLEVCSAGSDPRCMRCGRGKIMVVHGLTSNTEVQLRFVMKAAEDKIIAASDFCAITTKDVPDWDEEDPPVM